MTAYAFETMTAQQAQSFSALDSLTASGSANRATVIYGTGIVTISLNGRSLDFSPQVQTASQTGNVLFSDGSRLLIGDATNDSFTGTVNGDAVFGGTGNDNLDGADGADLVQGNAGNDTLAGSNGDDTIYGGRDNDRINVGLGTNTAQGNLGNDTLIGDSGKDTMRGGQDGDILNGGAGDDWLSGDRGDDTMTGGSGADFFHSFGDAGIDRITDFNRLEGDKVLLDAGTTFTVTQAGSDTWVDLSGGGRVVLVGIAQTSLTGDWIVTG